MGIINAVENSELSFEYMSMLLKLVNDNPYFHIILGEPIYRRLTYSDMYLSNVFVEKGRSFSVVFCRYMQDKRDIMVSMSPLDPNNTCGQWEVEGIAGMDTLSLFNPMLRETMDHMRSAGMEMEKNDFELFNHHGIKYEEVEPGYWRFNGRVDKRDIVNVLTSMQSGNEDRNIRYGRLNPLVEISSYKGCRGIIVPQKLVDMGSSAKFLLVLPD